MCDKIYGIELNEKAIDDAKKNAELNLINNVELFAADLHSSAGKIGDSSV